MIKVEPSDHDGAGLTELFMRVHFDYNPNQDRLIPSQDAGLSFRKGDILKVLNQEDSFWWQAMRVGEHQVAGLIPSLILEERSEVFNIASCSPLTSIACFLPSNHYHAFTFSLSSCFSISLPTFLFAFLSPPYLSPCLSPPSLRSLPLFLSPFFLPHSLLTPRRKAYHNLDSRAVAGCLGKRKQKRRIMYSSHHSGEFETYDLVLYEPVIMVENFQYKTLVLIGEYGRGVN